MQSCLDISGKWLVLNPLTTFLNDDSTSNVYTVFEFNMAQPDTPCNYFGEEYYQQVRDPEIAFTKQKTPVALTTFPGYMGAREGDNQFLSFAGVRTSAPGSAEFCPCGNSAKLYRDAFCIDGDVCISKNVMFMVKFPDPDTVIVGKTHSELVVELVEQTGKNLDEYNFC